MSEDVIDTPVRKKPGRPPRASRAATLDPGTMSRADMMIAMEALVEALRGNKEADVNIAAEIHARAMKKALRPENEIAPAVSVYNPQGETKHPRPKPTNIYMLAKYPICDPGNYDTTTWTEIELLNQLKGGEFPVTKADGTTVKVLVTQEQDAAGKPFKTTLFANGRGIQDDDQKNNWPPLLQILTEIVTGEGPLQSYARYQNRIAELEAKVAALSAA